VDKLDKKQIVIAIIVVGVVIALVGILADTIGLGESDDVFGTRQKLVTIIGIVVILGGIGLHYYGDQFFKKGGGEE
jgi:UDP-N-acetylmuramyl pentapeptide phosphotransferase/UDP-N-acetylglucosamine-1-phosphate transferase